MGAGLGEAEVRKASEIVRQLSGDAKARAKD
jgi:hypothetical protein